MRTVILDQSNQGGTEDRCIFYIPAYNISFNPNKSNVLQIENASYGTVHRYSKGIYLGTLDWIQTMEFLDEFKGGRFVPDDQMEFIFNTFTASCT